MSFLSRLSPVNTLFLRTADLLGTRASRLGERLGWDWLVYNPMTMWSYHRLARSNADPVMAAIQSVFPEFVDYVDVGAGTGAFAAAAARHGIRVRALERSRAGRAIAAAQRVHATRFDLRSEQPSGPRGQLAYCFEVAEHLDPHLGERLVVFLSRAAPVVVFTAARPGQGGYGHINEQPPSYWEVRFRVAGMEMWSSAAEDLRRAFATAGVKAPWFFDNLMVFRAAPTPDERVPLKDG